MKTRKKVKGLRAVQDPTIAELGMVLKEIRSTMSNTEVDDWYKRTILNGEIKLPVFKNIVNGLLIARNNVCHAEAALPIGRQILKEREERLKALLAQD
jgi:hypothetical protein